ncbi:hypothetical protein [Halorhodospira halophila]|uniref:hypothetical protein n=1 Tax=Halorhodospira halophila TaxID=1053 RepID=UPI0019133714|nr:hypothetical protein [Halorhodospira halophila]MBK5942943.1 hypothetical protein [Halorhodospira halophila]
MSRRKQTQRQHPDTSEGERQTDAQAGEPHEASAGPRSVETPDPGSPDEPDHGADLEASIFGDGASEEGQEHQAAATGTGARLKRFALPGAGVLVVLVVLGAVLGAGGDDEEDTAPAPELAQVAQRVQALEQELENQLQEVAAEQEQAIDALEQAQESGLQEIEQALAAHEEALTGLPSVDRVAQLEQQTGDLAAELEALEQQIPGVSEDRLDALDERLTTLEEAPENPRLEDARLLGFEHWAGSALVILAHDGETGRYRSGEAVGETSWRVSSVDPEAEVAVLRHQDGTLHALQVEEAGP